MVLRPIENMLGQKKGEVYFYSTFVDDLLKVSGLLFEDPKAVVYKLDNLTRVLDVLVTCEEKVEEQDG